VLVLKQSDRKSVVEAFSRLSLSTGNWLPISHPAANGIDLSVHKTGGSCPITGTNLAEYLAIAAPTHWADGWSYLSRALNSYFVGDAHSAWHFAYYAELRAAQSILSASGCGAFNRWNCILDNLGHIHTFGKEQTHDIVWQALEGLTDLSAGASSDIAKATSVFGHALPNIVQFAYPGISVATTSSNWIHEWMFDLTTSAADKGFRNRCSYDPHIVTPHRSDLSGVVDTVVSIWVALQPVPGATFMELDKQLIQVALEKAARDSLILKGQTPCDGSVIAELKNAYARIISSAPTFQSVPENFIARANVQHSILTHARNASPTPDTPQPVIARATLLLRIATGVTQNLLKDAGQSNSLDFWLDELAERQGIVVDRSSIPPDRREFHSDCATAAEDLDNRFSNGSKNLASLFSHPDVKPHLFSQLERVGQWSLSP